jgi:EAL domain-containing protein (putative c-di-GMP-specific phosphodiesterase class I)
MPLAKNLRLDVVAEGVETAEQAQELKSLDCKYAQGYFFSKPLSSEEAEALLAEHAVR